ncbi:hypothetical protein ESA94_10115 [Lacibacter luteus]|uniref:Uncharacterized protein n=1 Tax=Lacibacter luteus TaxID=2508719 RepID=A0A4Q1CJL6_9BACT|nr:hypothetical protein [Lacibacter luteus]RXK60806.1 hypothetical protein ESA94_10115 [Lacibacter luteus]
MKKKLIYCCLGLLLSCLLLSYTYAQTAASTDTTKKPRQTTLELREDGLIITLRIVTKADGTETVLTRIRNTRSDKTAVVLLISDDEKHSIKQVIPPGNIFTGNIGDIRGFTIGTDFVAPEVRDESGIIDWLKVKVRDYILLNSNGLEKKPLDSRGSPGVRG